MLQKSFLLLTVTLFNLISCNKGLKTKICFFLCFFCLTSLGLECSRIRKTTSIVMSHRLREIQKSASTELHEWSKNMVNVKNHQFLKGNYKFLSVIWVKWKQSVCSIILPCSSIFYSLFIPFFILEILEFKYGKFFIRQFASISKYEWFKQPCFSGCQK